MEKLHLFHSDLASLRSVAAVSFSFPGGEQTSERKNGRAKKYAWGEQKNVRKLGRSGEGWALGTRLGVSKKGEGWGEMESLPVSFPSRKFFSRSLPVLPVSFPSRKLQARQAMILPDSYFESLDIFFFVYHLHGETGWSMVCANGKQNSHIGNFRLGWRVPFEH